MAILKRLIAGALCTLLLSGCYEDITPRIDVEPVLCINSLITAGEPVSVAVSRTWVYTDTEAETDHGVSDARVSIFANGELRPADYLPQEGDEIRILVESESYGSAEATVTVPMGVDITGLEWAPTLISSGPLVPEEGEPLAGMAGYCTFNVTAELRFTDPSDTCNYYRFGYLCSWHGGSAGPDDQPLSYFNPGEFKYEAEPLFSEHIGVFESVMGGDSYGFPLFTDRQISGSDYNLHLRFANASYWVSAPEWDPELLDCQYELTLYSVSESYYAWSLYQWHREFGPIGDLSDIGLSEQPAGYSNVSTGAGIIAAKATRTTTITLAPFLAEVFRIRE